ncbi:hypothetical protein BDP27DRAFT_599502 [Rhodocollybia butyracea]|uniref:Uncharacterized protein n=1 Tax=Rhodocollybia butyracea TaxID=206335 RepID=A0A9P5Q976_9AGAR|nr:hypothetical protein BDP27DRAFT_599502 [Rhodocollybia butyracea]
MAPCQRKKANAQKSLVHFEGRCIIQPCGVTMKKHSNPRTVNSKTRLYSPFGLGTSLDIVYDYHYRCFRQNERYSTLLVYSRDIDNCNPKEPLKSMAVFRDKQGRQKPDPESVKVINMNGAKITGTTAKNLAEFEEMLFGGSGWLSTLKVFQLVAFAGTVGHYNEALRGSLLKKGGLEKFKLFKDETDGKSALRTADDKLLAELEAKEVQATNEEVDKVDEICIPQRLLLLAK